MTTHLILDVETVADTSLIEATGYAAKEGAFLPLIYHLPVAIAVGHLTAEGILTTVESLGSPLTLDDPFALTHHFWDLANHTAVLITYNGRAFDLPVLEMCALRYGVTAPAYWSAGQKSPRYRYGSAHLDMLDILSNYGGATKGLTLANVCQLLGYQGKTDDVDGSKVQALFDAGRLDEIREYNRRDICMTYAVYLHWARIAGRLTPALYQSALVASKPFLDLIRS